MKYKGQEIDFPLNGTITKEIVDKAHERILLIATTIRDVLSRHQISYSIFFGTVIGSVRHKGFIPWDLDMDFAIFDDYEEMVKILKKELPSWLIVVDNDADPNYCASWVKISDLYSEFHATTFAGDNDYKYRGLHVDLYNIKKTSYNEVCSYRRQEAFDYYNRKLRAGIITEDQCLKLCKKADSDYKKEVSERIIMQPDKPLLAFLKFFEGKPECIFPLKDYEFEGELFCGPNDYDMYLRSCYYKGNYMELPSFDKRDMKMDDIKIYPLPMIL